jgi:hypothetical protein
LDQPDEVFADLSGHHQFSPRTRLASSASRYVSEFYLTADVGEQVAGQPLLVDQAPISVSASHAESSAFSGDTKLFRIECDTTVSFAFGSAPVATTSNARMAASAPEYFQVVAGQKVSFVTNN